MEQEPKTPAEILNEGTRMRIQFLENELEHHLVHSGRLQEILDNRKKLDESIDTYFKLYADLATNPEVKADMDAIDQRIIDLQEILKDEQISGEQIKDYLEKTEELKRRIEQLQAFSFPTHVERN
jgi:hypothetical protein